MGRREHRAAPHRGTIARRSLATQVTLTLLVASLVPVLVLGVVAITAQRGALTERLLEDLEEVADAQHARLALIGDGAVDQVRLVASRTQLRLDIAAVLDGDPAPLPRIGDILDDAVGSTRQLLAATLVTSDGQVVATTHDRPGLPGPSITDAIQALDLTDPASQHSTLLAGDPIRWIVATPLQLDDRVLGAVVAEVDTAPVVDVTADPSARPGVISTCVFYLGASGPVPVRGDHTSPSLAPACQQLDPSLEASTPGDPQLVVTDGDLLATTRSLPELGWLVAVSAPETELLGPVRDASLTAGIAVLVVALLASAASAVLGRRLRREVRELQQLARAVGEGEFDTRVGDDAPGELGELATSLNEMTAAVAAHRAEMQHRYDDLEVLTHAMAHDLKGPLTAIRGSFDLIGAGRVTRDEDRQLLLERGSAAALRMQHLIDDLLALIRAIGAPLAMHPIDLGDIIDEATRELGLHDVITRTELPAAAGDWVLIEHVALNLLGNAARYHADDTPVRIHITADTRPDGWIALHIDDAGVGIPPDEREQVLELFHRGTRTTTTPGSGLGLPIVARVIDRHGGTLTLDDSPLGGTRATITLPPITDATPPPTGTSPHDPDATSTTG